MPSPEARSETPNNRYSDISSTRKSTMTDTPPAHIRRLFEYCLSEMSCHAFPRRINFQFYSICRDTCDAGKR